MLLILYVSFISLWIEFMWKLLCLLNENDGGRVSRSEHARLNFNSVEFQTKIQHKKLQET